MHPDDRAWVSATIEEGMTSPHGCRFECRVIWPDGSIHWIGITGVIYSPEGKSPRAMGVVYDITARKRAEALVLAQKKAFELVVHGAPLAGVLDILTLAAEEQSGGRALASILVADAEGKHLHHGSAPSLPAAYSSVVDGMSVGPSSGSCGTAAFRCEIVVVSSIQEDPLWTRFRDLATEHGLWACWSMPILFASGHVLGTFALYYRQAQDPPAGDREAVALLVNTAALVLDRYRENQERLAAETSLSQAQVRLETTLAAAEVSTWMWDTKNDRVYADRNLQSLFSLTAEQASGGPAANVFQAIHPDDLPQVQRRLDDALKSGKPYEAQFRVKNEHGAYRHVIGRGRVVCDASGSASHISGVALDVTAQKQAESELVASEERYRRLFEMMDQGFCVVEMLFDEAGQAHDYRFVEANPAFEKQSGIRQGIGRTARELHPNLEPYWFELYGRVAVTGQPLRFAHESKAMGRWFDVYASRVGDSASTQVAILFTYITERKRTEQTILEFNTQLERQANYDPLTGLPNRRLFRDRLDQEIKHAQSESRNIALLFLDLDKFKEVNDLLGHNAGDTLLELAAARIQQCLMQADTVARLGGDEFTVILTEANEVRHVEEVAQCILEALSKPFHIGHEQVRISTSIGITVYPSDAQSPEDLIRNADQAMYLSKAGGRNRLSYFKHSMQVDAMNRLRMISELRRAVPEKQLELHFQPVIELATGAIKKAEALVRWNHPNLGMVSPLKFIGLAEETGLICEIGNWVFMEAAEHARRWSNKLGFPFQVSINKSPVQFASDRHTLDWVGHLAKIGLNQHNIIIEITEGVLLNMSSGVADTLQTLRQGGFELSIDDFGTGYSSMSYLKKLDIDYLKIDQSFVRDMLLDQTTATIAETIIVMGHKLGLKIVAEGVETAEQRDWLQAHGCDYVQGYFFSHPIPVAIFEKLILK